MNKVYVKLLRSGIQFIATETSGGIQRKLWGKMEFFPVGSYEILFKI